MTITDFRMPLSEAIQLMKHTDLLIGMHGAGIDLSHTLFLLTLAYILILNRSNRTMAHMKRGENMHEGLQFASEISRRNTSRHL